MIKSMNSQRNPSKTRQIPNGQREYPNKAQPAQKSQNQLKEIQKS